MHNITVMVSTPQKTQGVAGTAVVFFKQVRKVLVDKSPSNRPTAESKRKGASHEACFEFIFGGCSVRIW